MNSRSLSIGLLFLLPVQSFSTTILDEEVHAYVCHQQESFHEEYSFYDPETQITTYVTYVETYLKCYDSNGFEVGTPKFLGATTSVFCAGEKDRVRKDVTIKDKGKKLELNEWGELSLSEEEIEFEVTGKVQRYIRDVYPKGKAENFALVSTSQGMSFGKMKDQEAEFDCY